MAPVFQDCLSSKHLITSDNVVGLHCPVMKSSNVGLYSPHILRAHTVLGTVQDPKMAEKHSPTTLDTTHVQMNASIFARVSPRNPRSLATHGVSYRATPTTDTVQTCNHACVSTVAVVTSLVLFCVSICLFLSLFLRCRGTVNRWSNNSRQRRTGSPIISTISFRRSMEFPPLPPYRENILSSSCRESTIFQDVSAINMSPNLIPQMDNQTNDEPNATDTDTDTDTDFVAYTSTIPSNPSSDTCEMPMPPTPLMTTIQLPPVEDEMELVDVTNITTLSLQCNPADADIGEVRLEALRASPSLGNLSDFVDGPSLGLIFEGGFSHISETRASEISESY